jgi:hypothetical protein
MHSGTIGAVAKHLSGRRITQTAPRRHATSRRAEIYSLRRNDRWVVIQLLPTERWNLLARPVARNALDGAAPSDIFTGTCRINGRVTVLSGETLGDQG